MTMNYATAIEQLDQKLHRTVTRADWEHIGRKAAADLTDDDINICGYFGGESSAAAARARRAKALAPPSPPEPPVPVTTPVAEPPALMDPDEFADLVIDFTKKVLAGPRVDGKFAALEARIAALEAETAALKAQPKSLDYCGVWQRASSYARNALVTHRSVTWACLTQARGVEPGTAPLVWQLAAKGDAR